MSNRDFFAGELPVTVIEALPTSKGKEFSLKLIHKGGFKLLLFFLKDGAIFCGSSHKNGSLKSKKEIRERRKLFVSNVLVIFNVVIGKYIDCVCNTRYHEFNVSDSVSILNPK